MKAEDTVLKEYQLVELEKIDRDSVLLAQAEITWPIAYKAGYEQSVLDNDEWCKDGYEKGRETEREKWLEKDKLQFCERHKLYHADTCCDCMLEIGRREVVGWIDKNVCYPYPVGSFGYIKWQKQRKKWGIDMKPKLCPKCGCDVEVWESELREKHKCPEDNK